MDRSFAFDRRRLLTALGGAVAAAALPATARGAVPGGAKAGLRVVVIGAGIAGLAAARDLEKAGVEVVLLEANDRVGGRAWTVRGGDRISHLDQDDQTVGFSPGLYLNVGPARIPSHHDQYLGLARELGVPLEVLVNSSRSNFVGGGAGPGGAGRVRLRQVGNDLRGHLAALLETALRKGTLDQELSAPVREKLVAFLKSYGDLADDLSYRGSQRAGLAQVPGATIEQAIAVPPLTLDELLANPELAAVLFDENILMQPTMLQPVGGMDRLPVALAAALRSPPRLNAEVREIRRQGAGVRVVYRDRKTGLGQAVEADRAIITTPLPILARTPNDFSRATKAAIAGVRYSDSLKIGFESTPFWEAEQIYGGISFVGGDTNLVWYPSGNFQAKRAVLLAAYSSRESAQRLSTRPRAEQIAIARAAVDRLHPGHGSDLSAPVLVHWGKVPFAEGPWIEWADPGNDARAAATLNAGDGPFLFAGSHLSAYSGHWQEGGILSARRAAALALQPRT
ncbi:FAD-dependent oxidoreductase [Novosphingobium sp. PS1R-30]|uniref:Tryptophan 2-monooxygenase n=1 Tax=Novosphingobium anseongense TaxID=3133436 RepID=A0ABU8RT53_9SPHN